MPILSGVPDPFIQSGASATRIAPPGCSSISRSWRAPCMLGTSFYILCRITQAVWSHLRPNTGKNCCHSEAPPHADHRKILRRRGAPKRKPPSHRCGPGCPSGDGGADLTGKSTPPAGAAAEWRGDALCLSAVTAILGPDRARRSAKAGPARPSGEAALANTIALVDDDRNILTSVSMALEAEGFAVRCYSDGAEALKGMTAQPVDLAVLDIKMPRMDGMELLGQLRRQSHIPVIFLTSKDDEVDELLGLRMGADDYIKKPFSQRLLKIGR